MINQAKNRLVGHPLVLLAVLCYAPVTVTAQKNDGIVLNVTVATEKGVAVPDLTREDFAVNIDKRPQTLLSFNRDVPASIGILLDTSGSVNMYGPKSLADQKQNFKAGLERFLQLGHPANEYFLMTFSNDIAVVQDWTSEPGDITNKLDSLKYDRQTALYDAISKAVPKVMAGRNAKHVLLVFSDGIDTYSRALNKDVRETLKRSDVVLFAVGIVNTSDELMVLAREGASILEEFAGNSGGRASFTNNPSKSEVFTKLFESLAYELRSQYQVVISPEQSVDKEKWRKLNVSATRNDASGKRQKLIVRTRQGYYR